MGISWRAKNFQSVINILLVLVMKEKVSCTCGSSILLKGDPAGDIDHKPSGRLLLLSTRPTVTFPAMWHHYHYTITKLYCLVWITCPKLLCNGAQPGVDNDDMLGLAARGWITSWSLPSVDRISIAVLIAPLRHLTTLKFSGLLLCVLVWLTVSLL